MKYIIQSFVILLTSIQVVFAQQKLPVLKTGKSKVSIREGDFDYRDVWTVSPEMKPDIFVSNPFTGTKTITFYSDIDSISFTVRPNRKYSFIISLNEKEKAYTQINTFKKESPSLEPKLFFKRLREVGQITDTIPFIIKDNRIHVKGKINNSDTLDFLFDTGASSCVVASALINTKVNLKIDGSQTNGGADGTATVGKSSKNTIEISNLKWDGVSLLSIGYQQPSFDAILSWTAFENRILEINYDKRIIVIHQSLPKLSSDYSGSEFKFMEGIPYLKLKLVVKEREIKNWFDFDTGSDGMLVVGPKFAGENTLIDNLKINRHRYFCGFNRKRNDKYTGNAAQNEDWRF